MEDCVALKFYAGAVYLLRYQRRKYSSCRQLCLKPLDEAVGGKVLL